MTENLQALRYWTVSKMTDSFVVRGCDSIGLLAVGANWVVTASVQARLLQLYFG
jgi:hypothetical protein